MRYRPTTSFPYGIDVPGREIPPGGPEALASRRTPNTVRPKRQAIRMADFCFIVAGLAALGGMTLGIVMGMAEDFTLAPAHVHLNLLGWVTMALYGLYHRSIGRVGGWLGWTQVLAGSVGAFVMSGGLALYLQTGDHGYMPLIVVGSLTAFLGMALFVVIVVIDLMRGTSLSPNTGVRTS